MSSAVSMVAERSPRAHAHEALVRGLEHLASLQHPDGRFEGEVVWNAMLPAQYVIACFITGTPISAVRRHRLLRQFAYTQDEEGLWGMHPQSKPYLFVTTLVYVASRLLNVPATDPLLVQAGAFIQRAGGAKGIPTWGKLWLALLNLYPWRGLQPLLPELWVLPTSSPIHPSKYYCHTRLIYLAMSFLYAQRLSTPLTPILDALRVELYPLGYDGEDFQGAPFALHESDVHAPLSLPLQCLFRAARVAQHVVPLRFRQRACRAILEQIRHEVRSTDGWCCSPVNGLLSWVALWSVDSQDKDAAAITQALEHWIWQDDAAGLRIAGARSQTWDTAFAVQALHRAHRVLGPQARSTYSAVRTRAAAYLQAQQLKVDAPSFVRVGRINPLGGFCFAGREHTWPVSDCTAEALMGLLAGEIGALDAESARLAVQFILRCRHPDGGFGSYEPRKGNSRLEWMNPAEMFGACMTEESYVECTASCVAALSAASRCARANSPGWPAEAIACAVEEGVQFLRRQQRMDGAWQASWGVHFLYGTFFAVHGLRSAGVPVTDPQIKRACRWILKHQRDDGGWGEDEQSAFENNFVADKSSVVQTSWALLTLLEGQSPEWPAIEKGIRYLVQCQASDGGWNDVRWSGVFFKTALLNYELYQIYFPIMALSAFCHHASKRLEA